MPPLRRSTQSSYHATSSSRSRTTVVNPCGCSVASRSVDKRGCSTARCSLPLGRNEEAMSDGKDGPPLARLFAIAYKQLIDTLHDRLAQRGWPDLRAGYGFVLLAVRDRPMSVTELADVLGVSKQATSKLVDVMTTDGYLDRRVARDDARQRDVMLTSRGRKLLR